MASAHEKAVSAPLVAKDLMTREVVCVAPDTPTREVARRLASRSISAAPVVTVRRFLDRLRSERKAKDVMSAPVVTVTEAAAVEITRLLTFHRIERGYGEKVLLFLSTRNTVVRAIRSTAANA